MLPGIKNLSSLYRKLHSNLRLLRQDSETFGRNLLQVTNPALFERRLIDVMNATPMQVRFTDQPDGPLRLNVLDASWSRSGMTGGPNTVINLALRIACEGVAVRLVSTVKDGGIDPTWLKTHAAALLGRGDPPDIAIASAAEAGQPLEIGPRDIFLATHWTTAHQLRPVLPALPVRQFFYMLQEFEPGFYSWSSNYARAIETMGMDFYPIINEAVLAEFLFTQPFGRLADPETRGRAIVFEPAVDRTMFHPDPKGEPGRRKRLLFYARPTNTRNLFGLGLLALREIAADPAFKDWDFIAIGGRGSVSAMRLGHGHVLRPGPWMDYAGYARVIQNADILFCPMLSPHTSYPVLEMAACGGISVTNTFTTKTNAFLAQLSPDIIAVSPTVEDFAEALREGARRVRPQADRSDTLTMSDSWDAALRPAALRVVEIMQAMAPQ